MNPLDFANCISVFFNEINKFIDPKYINNENTFTRKGKLTLKDIIFYALIQKGRTNAVEAYEFIKYLEDKTVEYITRQAIGQKRKYLDPQVYIDMYTEFIDKIYKNTHDLEKFKGYLVFSCDGSEIDLPNVEETRTIFPSQIRKIFKKVLARARISCIMDSYSMLIIDIKLAKKEENEISLAIQHLKNLKKRFKLKKIITIYDRGYNSTELMLQTIKHKSNFIIRLPKSTFAYEINKMQTNDEFIKISLNARRLKNIKDPEILKMTKNMPYIKLRITKIKLKSGETEILISNLPQEKFTTQDLEELYSKRWKIETGFDFLKNVVQVENFTGHSENIIKQDFYSSILLYNISMAMKLHSEAELKYKNKLKENKAINFNVTAGIIKSEMPILLKTSKKTKKFEILDKIIQTLKKQKITINRTTRKEMNIKNSDNLNNYPYQKRYSLL